MKTVTGNNQKPISQIHSSFVLQAAIILIGMTILPNFAMAFCGFYVAKADAALFNKTSQVILVRDGDHTTITMSSDFKGDVNDFAMVVPVPVVLQRDQIRTVDANIFKTLDAYSGPRLVEYYDENPCQVIRLYDQEAMAPMMDRSVVTEKSESGLKKYSVKIEARYTVDEYDVMLLSAKESSGLESWLVENGYKIPSGAHEVLQPYINSGMKFFVVKVNMSELKKRGNQFLSPLQITFSSPKFMLPIRLGMANSGGSQDMIVYAFTHNGRIETTNYRTVKVPTDKNVPEFVQNYFGKFYVDTYRKNRKEQGAGNVYLEYAWDISGTVTQFCDPCTGTPPMLADLVTAGVDWVQQYHYGYDGNVFFTRLHITYDRRHFPQDLQFEETPNRENFQARYIITHPATGDFSCGAGKRYLQDVRMRRAGELHQLATLTGWEISGYDQYVNTFNYFPGQVPEYHHSVNTDPNSIQNANDSANNNYPALFDSNQIGQESFNLPFAESGDDNNEGENKPLWMMAATAILLFLFYFLKRKKSLNRF